MIILEETYGVAFAKAVLVRRGIFKTAKRRGVASLEVLDSVDNQELDAWWEQLAPYLTHISNLNHIPETSDRRRREYSCGFECDDDGPEANTPWVKAKTSPFSSLSTPLSGWISKVLASPRTAT
jgi:hypothetical protein